MDTIIDDAYRTGDHENALSFSPITTIVDAAPDEDAQLQTILVRLAKRGEYDPLLVELAIANVGPHDTETIVDFLESLPIKEMEHAITDCGKNLVQCAACEEQLPARDFVLAPCGHCYCGSCVSIMFNAAVSDESRYPPRCCASIPIPIEHAMRFLDPGFETIFEDKGIEFGTVDRTYCSDPQCSTFIFPEDIESTKAFCPSCWKDTCVTCKAPAHIGDCPADLDLAPLLELAKEMRWQRCHNCLRVVQRLDGCNHMDCVCGASFCYICGRSMDGGDNPECLCFRDDPPVYRLYRPSDPPEPSDDGSQSIGPMAENERYPVGARPDSPSWDAVPFEDTAVGIDHERLEREQQRIHQAMANSWNNPYIFEDTPANFDFEQFEREQRPRIQAAVERWEEVAPSQWAPPSPISTPPPGLDWGEEYMPDKSSSILERVADFLNF
ncbi:hypothetical protein E4T44_02180 [Aureobasidium sp. EXF-8845]|nr:hypothetical protein E4T44_02180 [Aureobasidium sp. EXF-8845]KAI4856474.1 hypothetical protein E4T45_02062 [Aureobasidium sp. EXF-8846]